MPDDALTAEDAASIDAAGDELHRRGWRKEIGLSDAIDRWAVFVKRVEAGDMMTIDDDTNDLSIRRWAEEARPILTERVEQSMNDHLAPLDARFRDATDPTTFRLPGAGPTHWWECRIPKVLTGELAEDLERLGKRAGPA